MKKERISLALALVLGLSLAGGISGQSALTARADGFEPRLDTEEDAVVNIIGILANFESLEAVISDFEEYYPNCEVLYSQLGTGDYASLLGPRLLSDDSVGIFTITNLQYTGTVVDACADLLEEEIDFSAISQEVLNSCIADGKLYCMPLALDTSGLIVNTTLLEQEGLSVPTTYTEFLDVCASLKEKGYTPVQGYSQSVTNLIRNMVYFLLGDSCQTEEEMAALLSGEEGCAEVIRPALEILQELLDNGYIDPEVNAAYEDSYNDSILKFFEGDVPFLMATTETYSGTKKRETKSEHFAAEPFEYEFICTPLTDTGAYTYLESWQGFALNANCPDKEWAVEFLRFLATEEEMNQLASIKGLPSAANESDDERYTQLYSVSEENLRINNNYFPDTVDDVLYDAEMALTQGEADVDGALALMEAELAEAAD